MKRALVFAGQGSQYVGMTKDVTESFIEAREMGVIANEILGYDLLSLMHNGPADRLTETRYTQSALFVHEAMILKVTGIAATADAVAGHSLGEYSALYAAGALSFDEALRLVHLRGTLMFDVGQQIPGTMAAVVGLSDDAVESVCAEYHRGDHEHTVVSANYNAPGQVVISGSRDYIRELVPAFKAAGAKIVKELQVSGAFHSPLLAAAQAAFSEALDAASFADARIPVYTNVDAQARTKSDELRAAAKAQLTSPVRWTQSVQAMASAGISEFIEIGPGAVLQGLVKRTVEGAIQIRGIDTAEQCIQWNDSAR